MKNHEQSPDGSPDENIFGITLGVSIAIFVKKTDSDQLGRLHHCDMYGKKRAKKEFLNSHSLTNVEWTDLTPVAPDYFFVPKDFTMQEEYEQGFCIDQLFKHYNSGVQSKRDELNIFFSDEERKAVLHDFKEGDLISLHGKYKLEETSGWSVHNAIKDMQSNPVLTTKINYRPFDTRFTNYTGKSSGMMGRPRHKTSQHLIGKDNLALITCKQQSSFPFQHVFVTRLISDLNSISAQSKEQSYVFPLYVYDKDGKRMVNFNREVVRQISSDANPQTIFDYVYAVLHSNHYRQRYRELLKLGFPRIPYPQNQEMLESIAAIGARLRELHLLESLPAGLGALGVSYQGRGNDTVEKMEWCDNAVWINNDNRFEGISDAVWNFYIGGYQPMQKWLQYRKNRRLSPDDIIHYEKMAYAIKYSINLIKELDSLMLL